MAKKKERKLKTLKVRKEKLVRCFWCEERIPDAIKTNGKWLLPKASSLCLSCDKHLNEIFHPNPATLTDSPAPAERTED